MTGLPKHIIKKYGMTKKAWQVFRGKTLHSGGTTTMAKRRRRSGFFKRRAGRRFGGSSENLMMTAAAAGVYGAFRPKVEQMIAPLTSKIPVGGNYVDELALGTVGYLLAKNKLPFFKGKMARSVGKAVLVIEAARVGSGLSAGISLGSGDSSGTAW